MKFVAFERAKQGTGASRRLRNTDRGVRKEIEFRKKEKKKRKRKKKITK